MLNLTKPLIAILLTLGLVHTAHSYEHLHGAVLPLEEYSEELALEDLQEIDRRLQASTQTLLELTDVLNDIADRLEGKQQLTATNN